MDGGDTDSAVDPANEDSVFSASNRGSSAEYTGRPQRLHGWWCHMQRWMQPRRLPTSSTTANAAEECQYNGRCISRVAIWRGQSPVPLLYTSKTAAATQQRQGIGAPHRCAPRLPRFPCFLRCSLPALGKKTQFPSSCGSQLQYLTENVLG